MTPLLTEAPQLTSISLTGSKEDMEMAQVFVRALHFIAYGQEAGEMMFNQFPVLGGFLLYREACKRAPSC